MNEMRRNTNLKGFTIVELLIVIVVVAILAAIVIVAYNGVQVRSKASAIASGLKSTEKAFRLYAIDKSYDSWPADSTMITGISTNPTIQQFIDNTSFKDYMQKAPNIANTPSLYWFYDYDTDTRPNCGSRYAGVNIIILYLSQDIATQIDKDIDDGDPACGRVRYDGTTTPAQPYFFYSLSFGKELSCFSSCTN
jgi:prepilin-type N-terminal cleavage/methylation domain-containing protein